MKTSFICLLLFFGSLVYCQTELAGFLQDPLSVPDEEPQINETGSPILASANKDVDVFPEDAWGVYSWFGLDKVSRETTPHIKGTPIILRWSDLEPENGKFEFDKEIRKELEHLDNDDFNTFLMIWVAFATSNVTEKDTTWVFTPKWIFKEGVPLVAFPETINPLGVSTKRYFPYYLDEDYKFFFHRMIDSLGNYICNLPEHLQRRILFLQSAEGSTGDGQPYKGEPIDPQYNISKEQWSDFRIETWERYKSAFTVNGELQLPILTNYDSNEEEQYRWMLDSLPRALGLKNGMFSHGYHISEAQQRLESFIQFRNEVKASGKVFFARGEQDAEWKTYGWSTQNPKQAFYWSALYATHCGLTMWNVPWEACIGETYADAIHLFNRFAAETDPATAKRAFSALRRGLDASDTAAFPEQDYGLAVKENTQRYIDIADAFSAYGANQGDPEKATGHGMINRKRMDYNDAGWKILKGNYQRHIRQIDPEETSIAWWQVDESIYGRFARGFDIENDRNTMYFDVDDLFFAANRDKGDGWLKLKIIYNADDGGSWEMKYHAMDGTMKTACIVDNEAGAGWLVKEVTIGDAMLDNGGPRGADLILQNSGNTNCRFHMIELEREVIIPEENNQTAYGGTPRNIPGLIEAEHYDEGGEGYAYHDNTIREGNANYRTGDFVDVVENDSASNGYAIGFTAEGEWLEYTVQVMPGQYDVSVYYLCDTVPGELEVYLDSTFLTTIGGWKNTALSRPDSIKIGNIFVPGGKKKILRLSFARGTAVEIDAIRFTGETVQANGISLNHCPVKDLYIGNYHQMYATIEPSNTTDKRVVWSSSDSAVAQVDSMGLVSAVSAGTTVITAATIDGNYAGKCTLNVVYQSIPVRSVQLDNCPSYDLLMGTSYRLKAIISPADADNPSVSWSSSDVAVATVNSDGWISTLAEGTTRITVTTSDGLYTANCWIRVAPKVIGVKSVMIENCPGESIKEGDTLLQLRTIIEPEDASDQSVIWHSSNPSVVRIDTEGVVYANSPGSATVTVLTNSGYYSDQCSINVQATTNINETIETAVMVEIHPCPAGETIHFRFRETGTEKHIKIYNLFGQLLFYHDTYYADLEIETGEFPTSGIVIVHVLSGAETYSSSLILDN